VAVRVFCGAGRVSAMCRVIAIVGAGLAVAACSSTPDWTNFGAFKPTPIVDTVRFESEPPGAEAKASDGQTCRTPCALVLPVNAPLTVTFRLNGYQPETETVEPILITGSPTQLRPNPVVVELMPAAPPPKPVKKLAVPKRKAAPKKKTTVRPAAGPKPAAAPAPMSPAPAQQQVPTPQLEAPAPQPASPPR
jgi:hypothetical protein